MCVHGQWEKRKGRSGWPKVVDLNVETLAGESRELVNMIETFIFCVFKKSDRKGASVNCHAPLLAKGGGILKGDGLGDPGYPLREEIGDGADFNEQWIRETEVMKKWLRRGTMAEFARD